MELVSTQVMTDSRLTEHVVGVERGSLLLIYATGRVYDYFACLGRKKGTGCKLPYLPAHEVEEQVRRPTPKSS